TVLAGLVLEQWDPTPAVDDLLTTSQGVEQLGISRPTLVGREMPSSPAPWLSRPTLVAWLEAGRIPFQWRGTHRRVARSDVLAYLDRLT
ncbi:MAG: helix-turn-helix domain-containing protein, partial [Nitriliruptoraceae bacterium]